MQKLDVINEELERLHSDYNGLVDFMVNENPDKVRDALVSQLEVIQEKLTYLYDIVA